MSDFLDLLIAQKLHGGFNSFDTNNIFDSLVGEAMFPSKKMPPAVPDYLYFEAYDNNTIVGAYLNESEGETTLHCDCTWYYTKGEPTRGEDGWTKHSLTDDGPLSVTLSAGEKLYLKGYEIMPTEKSHPCFDITAERIMCGGNVGSIIVNLTDMEDIDNFDNPNRGYGGIWANACYGMFAGTPITSIPKFPGLTSNVDSWGKNACSGMFESCMKLVDLSNCVINIESTVEGALSSMFAYCSNLKKSPYLNFTSGGVANMATNLFKNCSKLNEVTVHFNGIIKDTNFSGWLSGVASSGVVKTNATVENLPNNWTIGGLPT